MTYLPTPDFFRTGILPDSDQLPPKSFRYARLASYLRPVKLDLPEICPLKIRNEDTVKKQKY